MNPATGSVEVATSQPVAPTARIPLPREEAEAVSESDGSAGRLGQRLVDRKLDELRRARQDPEPATEV